MTKEVNEVTHNKRLAETCEARGNINRMRRVLELYELSSLSTEGQVVKISINSSD